MLILCCTYIFFIRFLTSLYFLSTFLISQYFCWIPINLLLDLLLYNNSGVFLYTWILLWCCLLIRNIRLFFRTILIIFIFKIIFFVQLLFYSLTILIGNFIAFIYNRLEILLWLLIIYFITSIISFFFISPRAIIRFNLSFWLIINIIIIIINILIFFIIDFLFKSSNNLNFY